MMNSMALLDLARERSRDMVDAPTRNRTQPAREEALPAAEEVFLYGHSAHLIDARVHAQAHLRVGTAALDLS
jgi:hypothetical protein